MDLLIILLIVLMLFGGGGGFLVARNYGPVEGSGLFFIVLIVCLIVYLRRERL